jgi:hypothetical protein
MDKRAKPVRDALRRRETNFRQICAAIPISYTHFSEVLSGRREGRHTWPKLRNYFTDDERALVVAGYGEVFD